MDLRARRKAREYQARSRGDKRSYKSDFEDALLSLCWFNTDLSEGQCAKLMGTDILGFRIRRDDLLKEGLQLAESLRKGE